MFTTPIAVAVLFSRIASLQFAPLGMCKWAHNTGYVNSHGQFPRIGVCQRGPNRQVNKI